MIELLLVLVIIGVITAVAVPEYVRSMRGNRLRTAGRTVIAAGRYARSMAVLHQRSVAVQFEVGGGQLTIDEEVPVISTNEPAAENTASVVDDADRPTAKSPGGPGMGIRLERMLDSVTIEDVRVQGTDTREATREGTVMAVYQSNGRCTPYVVRLADREGGVLVIRVDALASAESSREGDF